MRGKVITDSKIENWKDKSKRRRIENEKLKRRIKELRASRDNWKHKYMSLKSAGKVTGPSSRTVVPGDACKPKYHAYETRVILLVLQLRQQGLCSLRCCSKMLMVLNVYFHLQMRIPCANTIRNWETKHGLYRLSQSPRQGSEWMIIVDESIGIGKQKLLLVLGVDLSRYTFGKAPGLKDVSVLDASIAPSWKWQEMRARLELLKQRGFDVKYAVSDAGASVVKSLAETAIPRVADCTHVFGNIIKKHYSQSELFEGYCRFCRRLQRQVSVGKDTPIIPPSQRKKGKYLNIFPLVDWGRKMLALLDGPRHRLSAGQVKKLAPLKDYRPLIGQMGELCDLLNGLSAVLKNQGLNQATKKQCHRIISQADIPVEIRNALSDYLQANWLPAVNRDSLICSSDIIESTFGKYKRNLNLATKGQINDNCLFIANYCEKFSLEETRQAMEQFRMVDLAEWKEKNTVASLAKQQQELFKNVG